MKKQPHITEQTKNNFFKAFWELYKTEDMTKITIGKICQRANYNRTTFYRYFIDISDILSQIEDEIIDRIKTGINSNINRPDHITLDRFKVFNEKFGEYIITFYEKENRHFFVKFKELVINEVYDYLNFNISDTVSKNFLYEFLFSSITVSYAYWYRHQEIMSFEAFAKLLNNLLLDESKIIISNLNS